MKIESTLFIILTICFIQISFSQNELKIEKSENSQLIKVLNNSKLIGENGENNLSVRIYTIDNGTGSAGYENSEVSYNLLLAVSEFDEEPNQSLFEIGPFIRPEFINWTKNKNEEKDFEIEYGITENRKTLSLRVNIHELKTNEKIDLSKVPDSLKIVANKTLKGDFNGDSKIDYASIVINKKNQKTGVLIIHNSNNKEIFVFGAGQEINNNKDLDWIEVFETLPKGEIVSPTIVNEETGDIIGQDENQNFKLIGNGIYMSVEESHGGGILFWNGKEYKWYHIE